MTARSLSFGFIPALLLGALALSSCVSVLPKAAPASARFQVNDVTIDTPPSPVSWTLSVENPDSTLAFNTTKIALSREPTQIEYYAGGEWVDRAPRLFGVALVRSFENTGAIHGIGNRITLPTSTYVLQTDVRKLMIVHEGRSLTATTVVFARLTNGRSKIYASKLFSAAAPVPADNANASATALNTGLDQVQREIVAWTFEQASLAQSAKN